jgi:hypothetical protein
VRRLAAELADLACYVRNGIAGETIDHHARAVAREEFADRFADPGAAAGHDRDFVQHQ